MANLFAICRVGEGLIVKRVVLHQDVQAQIEVIFTAQVNAFLDGVDEELAFGSDWKPDSNEIFAMDCPADAASVAATITAGALTLETISPSTFPNENIKALAVAIGQGPAQRILIQMFTAQQVLSRKFALISSGDTFNVLRDQVFALDNYLVALIENGRLKFKSYHLIKRIFAFAHLYEEATNEQIDTFCSHDCISVPDVIAFKSVADQTIRKLVHAVHTSNVINQYGVNEIAEKARLLGMTVKTASGKIVFPEGKKEIKLLLSFLDDGFYEAVLTSRRYITNSKKLHEDS